jgi:parallel beta-helix repeat protein
MIGLNRSAHGAVIAHLHTGGVSGLLAIAALMTLLAGPAQAVTHRVLVVPRDFATIQAAVDAAAPGDTVNVGSGTYIEQVVINKDLNLRGAGAAATVIKAPTTLAPYGVRTGDNKPLSAIVRVGRHAQVHLSGLNVTGPVPCVDIDEGIGVVEEASLDVSDTRVSDLVAQGCSGEAYGIVFGVSPSYAINGVPGGTTASGRVSHVVIDTFQSAGIIVVGPYGRAPSRVTLTDNTVTAGTPVDPADQVGIWIRLNAVGQVTGNSVSGGVCTYDGCGPDFISQFQSFAAIVEGGGGTTFTGNHLSGADIGLLDYNSANSTISGNTLVDNTMYGIFVGDTDAVTKNNTITGGRFGIGVWAFSQDTSELSSGDHISGASVSATQTYECCGFHVSLTVKN